MYAMYRFVTSMTLKVFLHIVPAIACATIGYQLFFAIKSFRTLVDTSHQVIEEIAPTVITSLNGLHMAIESTQTLLCDVQPHIISTTHDLNTLVVEMSDVLRDTKVETNTLLSKLQSAADNWNSICQAIELVPLRKQLKTITGLPFMLCGKGKDSVKENT